ncbi:MAG: transposase [Tannerellaceae bacterium]|nr:transposase [Tannerellaceae bacterium]
MKNKSKQKAMKYQNRITGKIYFVTTTVVDWIDIFTRPQYKHIILDSLKYCQQQKGLIIYAWVLMTNHLHLIAGTEEGDDISFILRDFKKFTSKKIIQTLKSDLTESRSEWMLDKFSFSGRNDSKIKEYRFWQGGVDIQELFVNDFLYQKLNYLHGNPVKMEFVAYPEDFTYSSAGDYAGKKGLLDVVLIE